MSAYVVKAKRGAVIRLEASLESEHVSKLEMGTEVGVVETVELGEVTRCRLSHPVRGWCSLKVLETVSEAPPLALRDGAVLRVFESSGGDSESSRGGASVLGPPSWEVKHYQKRCGAVLRELAEAYDKTTYQSSGGGGPDPIAVAAAKRRYRGFWGPWMSDDAFARLEPSLYQEWRLQRSQRLP